MRRLAPGLLLALAGTALAFGIAGVTGASPLVASVALGAVTANLVPLPRATGPGLAFAAKRLLRLGVVLLGFRLSLADVARLGGTGLATVAAVVALTFLGTRWLAGRLRLSSSLGLLVAVGFAICGASAIAAVDAVIRADDEDVAYAIALVTLCGTVSIVLLPALRPLLGLDPATFGQFVGASVHDVAQVVATAATAGSAALESAVVVKLTRVLLLAPIVIGLSAAARRPGLPAQDPSAGRPPLVQLFVAGFLGAVAVRSLGFLPEAVIAGIQEVEQLVLASALFGLGCGVRLRRLVRIGPRPLVLGLLSWVLVAVTAYLSLVLVAR